MNHLTIVYITSRLNPRIEWFLDSLHIQTAGDYSNIRLVIVDFFKEQRPLGALLGREHRYPDLIHTEPKPNVWQGKHKLGSIERFAASNARNTGLLLAKDGWIAYVDDLSVLMPGWLANVHLAMGMGYCVLGAYKKVRELTVVDGVVTHRIEHPGGLDSRWSIGSDGNPVDCSGNILYGCSFACPVQALLDINGCPEDVCDGMGYDDQVMGGVMWNRGYRFRYSRNMLTLESEEAHNEGPVFLREDPGEAPKDKSHKLLDLYTTAKEFPNDWPEGGLAEYRQRCLRGEPFVIKQTPTHDWFTGRALAED